MPSLVLNENNFGVWFVLELPPVSNNCNEQLLNEAE